MKGQGMKNILEYLEKTAEQYPGHRAVEDPEGFLTWRQLEKISRKMGSFLGNLICPGEPILILGEKSPLLLAAMFGTVYGGGFYVTADGGLPVGRIREILEVLEPKAAVAAGEKEKELLWAAGYTGNVYTPEELKTAPEDWEFLKERRENSQGEDLLYGIFTSGSTGKPKGIVVSHQAVIDFITHFTEIFGIKPEDRIGNQAPFDFDVSVKDIYSCVMTGAELVLIPKPMFSSPPVLLDYLENKKVTVMIWAVSALTLISALKGLEYKVPVQVKKILFSGEVMPVKHLRKWQEALPKTEFVNLYGPTEITCNCTYFPVKRKYGENEKIPVGRAFPGRRVFLLDNEGKEIHEAESPGEICVSGESLSRGYYGNPEETEKRFFYLSSMNGQRERCYRTGDLGYWGKEGELYFCGRKDFQIKLRGHRIELEEIEQILHQVRGVEKSACLVDEQKECLTAFYMGTASCGEIRGKLKESLPSYMIPRKIIHMEQIPLNKNGKTDRKMLRQKLEVKDLWK